MSPFPIAFVQNKFFLVVIDYFIKWVEVETFTTIKDKDVIRFLWKNAICRFGIPRVIISNNGPQFDSSNYRTYISHHAIDATDGSLALKAYQQNLYLKYYY